MIKRHNTKWAVRCSLKHDKAVYFTSLEDAKAYAYEYGYAIYPPIFA